MINDYIMIDGLNEILEIYLLYGLLGGFVLTSILMLISFGIKSSLGFFK